jgi:hypothetical protein
MSPVFKKKKEVSRLFCGLEVIKVEFTPGAQVD